MPRYDVVHSADLYGPRHAAMQVGATLGFSRTDCHELAIVVSELTSNILKYGVRGSIELDVVESAELGRGLLVTARDLGPPFRNLDTALKDGHDDRGPIDPGTLLRRGGIGAGLGAVLRLTDTFQVESLPLGKAIRVVRYVRRPRRRESNT
jgi:anti-sigma regulatory factor (Ser/Thr protein kinase)